MDSGDRPTCSKYWREPEPEPEEDPEPEPGSPSVPRADEEDDESVEPSQWQKKLPATVLREIGSVLQLAEVKNLRHVCRDWASVLDWKFLLKSRRFAVDATHFQWEPIHYSHALYAPRIFPRMFHCGAHHPLTDKIYMFGGNGLQRIKDNYDFDAHFNDVWTYDLCAKKWDRLLVPGTPYPSPKSRSSLVVWREYLVLFGGFRRPNKSGNRPGVGAAEFPARTSSSVKADSDSDDDDDDWHYDGPDRGDLPAEVHYLNVKTNMWELATPIKRENSTQAGRDFLLKAHDHAAAVFDNWMVVVGGMRTTPWTSQQIANDEIFLFDLEEKVWYAAPKPFDTFEEKLNAPLQAEHARGTLALIRPGRLLYHPCFPIRYPRIRPQPPAAGPYANQPQLRAPPGQLLPAQAMMARQRDTMRCYYLDFDPDDVLYTPWRWRPVPVASPHLLRPTGPLAPPVVVQSDNRVRLVNAVIETRRTRRDSDLDTYSGLQYFATTIKREIHTRLAQCSPAEFYDSLALAPFEFELDCNEFYKHIETHESGRDALKLIVSVLQGKSGHIGDYKVCIRFLDTRYVHVFARGVTNFIQETTAGYLPTKGGGKSPHAASTEKTLQLVRASSRRVIKLLTADLTAHDEAGGAGRALEWEETADRPTYEECPVPATGLLLVQADGAIFVTGGESAPDDDGVIDTSIGGGTWMANPMK